jgi:hypothetical protein
MDGDVVVKVGNTPALCDRKRGAEKKNTDSNNPI